MANPETTAGAPLLLRDLRSSEARMHSLTFKVPVSMIEALDQAAATYRAPRSSVARTLLATALEGIGASC